MSLTCLDRFAGMDGRGLDDGASRLGRCRRGRAGGGFSPTAQVSQCRNSSRGGPDLAHDPGRIAGGNLHLRLSPGIPGCE